jgi:hypothetical protein
MLFRLPGRHELPAPQLATSAASIVVLLMQGFPLFTLLRQIALLKAPASR